MLRTGRWEPTVEDGQDGHREQEDHDNVDSGRNTKVHEGVARSQNEGRKTKSRGQIGQQRNKGNFFNGVNQSSIDVF